MRLLSETNALFLDKSTSESEFSAIEEENEPVFHLHSSPRWVPQPQPAEYYSAHTALNTPPSLDHIDCNRVQNLDLALQQVHEQADRGQHGQRTHQIECNRVQNLEQALNDVHEQFPHLQPVQPGRVYDMAPILEGIQQIGENNYNLRERERHDYRQLHLHGRGEKEKRRKE